jgi:hypothetical protein
MLAVGYEKEWSRIIMQATVLNFVFLIPLIFLIWPPAAVSITGLLVDLFAAAATYRFFGNLSREPCYGGCLSSASAIGRPSSRALK